MRCRSPTSCVKSRPGRRGTTPSWIRNQATDAWRLAELDSPAPSGTSPAMTASKPDSSGPAHSVIAQQTPRVYRAHVPASLRSIASSEQASALLEVHRDERGPRGPATDRPTTTVERSIAAAMTRPPL